MSEVISFWGKTIDDVSKDIQTSETKRNQFLRNDKQETIPQAIHKNGFSFSRYFSFCHDFLVMYEKRLD